MRISFLFFQATSILSLGGLDAFIPVAVVSPPNSGRTCLQLKATSSSPTTTRSDILRKTSAVVFAIFATPAWAQGPARVKEWPGLEYLEPLYELYLSVDAMQTAVKNQAQWEPLANRLDRFFSGFVVNERNYYAGLSLQYTDKIQYDDLPSYVTLDKQQRFDAMKNALKSLENLKTHLQRKDESSILQSADDTRSYLAQWFALVPREDFEAVGKLFKVVRLADINRDGRLSEEELSSISAQDREVWERRVKLVGT